jgi:hypothetical protein
MTGELVGITAYIKHHHLKDVVLKRMHTRLVDEIEFGRMR